MFAKKKYLPGHIFLHEAVASADLLRLSPQDGRGRAAIRLAEKRAGRFHLSSQSSRFSTSVVLLVTAASRRLCLRLECFAVVAEVLQCS